MTKTREQIEQEFENINRPLNLDIQKGRAAVVGEVRDWGGKKYKKQGNGKWVEVSEAGKTKDEHIEEVNRLASKRGEQMGYAYHSKKASKLSDKEYDESELMGRDYTDENRAAHDKNGPDIDKLVNLMNSYKLGSNLDKLTDSQINHILLNQDILEEDRKILIPKIKEKIGGEKEERFEFIEGRINSVKLTQDEIDFIKDEYSDYSEDEYQVGYKGNGFELSGDRVTGEGNRMRTLLSLLSSKFNKEKDESKDLSQLKYAELEAMVPGYLTMQEFKAWSKAEEVVKNWGNADHYNKTVYDDAARESVRLHKEYKNALISKIEKNKGKVEKSLEDHFNNINSELSFEK